MLRSSARFRAPCRRGAHHFFSSAGSAVMRIASSPRTTSIRASSKGSPRRRSSTKNSRFPAGSPKRGCHEPDRDESQPRGTPRAASEALRDGSSGRARPRPSRPVARPASNCGFTSATIAPPSRRYATARVRIVRSEMNDDVDKYEIEAGWKCVAGEFAEVRALHHANARIVAQLPSELTVADVDGGHACRAALEQRSR